MVATQSVVDGLKEDVHRFANILVPKIEEYFFDWCGTEFTVGNPIYNASVFSDGDCYDWNHSGVSDHSIKGDLSLNRRTERLAISGIKNPENFDKSNYVITKHRGTLRRTGTITPSTELFRLMTSCNKSGEPYAELWERELRLIAQSVCESVANAYIKERNTDVNRLVGIKTLKTSKNQAVTLLEFANVNHIALKAVKGWYYSSDFDLRTMTLQDALDSQTKMGRIVTQHKRQYAVYRDKLLREYRDEAQSVGLSEEEQTEEFSQQMPSMRYAMMATRLSTRQLALVAWAKRIKCDKELREKLSAPILHEANLQLAEIRRDLAPLKLQWEAQEYNFQKLGGN